MFEQSFVGRTQTKTRYSVLASLLLQSVMIGVAVLIPLIYTSPLPAWQLMSYVIGPRTSPPPGRSAVKIREAPRPKFDAGKLTSPAAIPRRIAIIDDEAAPAQAGIAEAAGGVPGGLPGGSFNPLLGDLVSTARILPPASPPVVETPKPRERQRLKVGGLVQKSKQIYAPLPVYPPLARQARVSGVVKLNAIIAKDGTVQQLAVIAGHVLLIPAALEAVSRWHYSPTLLNGEPVEVITQIDVHFTLR